MANRRRNRGGGRIFTYLFVIILVAVVAFVLFRALGGSTAKTAVIESDSTGKQYVARAVILRNETLTDTEGLTSVKYHANEGEMVYTGSKIADVYSSGYSQADMSKLLSTRANIKSSIKAMLASEYSDTVLDRLDKLVLDYAQEVGLFVRGKTDGNLLNLERQLTTALNNRQNHFRENYTAKNVNLRDLYNSEVSLQKKIQSWTTSYIADRDCLISFYTDGWENVLDTSLFDEIPASTVNSVLAGDSPPQTTAQRGRSPVFRQVTPTGWYLLLISEDKNWMPVDGQTYRVQLVGFENVLIDGLVSSHARNGNELLVRMHVTGSVREVLNERTADARVFEEGTTNLKVPLKALYSQNGMQGVVLNDGNGVFVPIDILGQTNTDMYISSQVPGALREGQIVRLF